VGFGRDFNFYLKIFDSNHEAVVEKTDKIEAALELSHIVVSKVAKASGSQYKEPFLISSVKGFFLEPSIHERLEIFLIGKRRGNALKILKCNIGAALALML
jgi:hypothetical protein